MKPRFSAAVACTELYTTRCAGVPDEITSRNIAHAGRRAVLCSRYSDEEYRKERCKSEEEYHRRYGQHGIDRIWRCRLTLLLRAVAPLSLLLDSTDSKLGSLFPPLATRDDILPCRVYLRHCVLAAKGLVRPAVASVSPLCCHKPPLTRST